MKLKLELYGTLRERFPGYEHSGGMEVEIPEGSTAKDLIAFLEIPQSTGALVIMAGRVLMADDEIEEGRQVKVFQAIHGG
jgi:sulfur carrier protein ThiS